MYGEIWAGNTGRDLGEEVFGRKESGEVVMGIGLGKGKGGGKGRVVRVDGDVAMKNDQVSFGRSHHSGSDVYIPRSLFGP